MTVPVTVFIIAVTGVLLLYQATCPPVAPVPRHICGLGSHSRLEHKHKQRAKRYKLITTKDFRRQIIYVNTIKPRMESKAGWKVKNPEHLWSARPQTAGPVIYWNLTNNRCDYMRIVCMRAYKTGTVCARTVEYIYDDFSSYCNMDFQNCITGLDIWFIAYMGHCTTFVMERELYADMTYDQMANNSKLKQMYIADLGDETNFESFITHSDDNESVATTTVQTAIYNYTDKDGNAVTVSEGVFATYIVIVTLPMVNVTDEKGNVMTDFYGDWVTMTAPPTTKK